MPMTAQLNAKTYYNRTIFKTLTVVLAYCNSAYLGCLEHFFKKDFDFMFRFLYFDRDKLRFIHCLIFLFSIAV